jgi:hypothetical protein
MCDLLDLPKVLIRRLPPLQLVFVSHRCKPVCSGHLGSPSILVVWPGNRRGFHKITLPPTYGIYGPRIFLLQLGGKSLVISQLRITRRLLVNTHIFFLNNILLLIGARRHTRSLPRVYLSHSSACTVSPFRAAATPSETSISAGFFPL